MSSDLDQWLSNNIKKHIETHSCPFSEQELSKSVLETLTSTKSNEELQETLINLIGLENFDLVLSLLQNRRPFIEREINKLSNSSYARKSDIISIKTGTQERNEKIKGKLIQKLKKLLATLPDTQELKYIKNDDNKEKSNDYIAISGSLSQFQKKLPHGTIRNDCKTFTSYKIPVPSQPEIQNESLLKIDEVFDDFAKVAFKGFKTLNRIQSRVFNAAYNSNENLLICAPTGAGKTNIALMTMLQEIKHHIEDGIVQDDQFKIIYIAPMKALASEMTDNFSKRLKPLNMQVKELTGDMQLTKREIQETQVIVTTPEKWDVITRKSTDSSFTQLVRLIIIDEVHLLHEERGPVIESIVARTLRLVEQTQKMTRIVGLSATLPNYKDVAKFLGVNESTGLFYFDGSYRPVPLSQEFIGVKEKDQNLSKMVMTNICFDKIVDSVKAGNQCMVFVHSRKDTVNTCKDLIDMAKEYNLSEIFQYPYKGKVDYVNSARNVSKSPNHELKDVFRFGFGFHHAGMLRSDRNLVEELFREGFIKVLVCTATLAWGVNLPAHTVIIKGTQLYNPERGGYVDIGIMDVMQIFGRAGRPQYDTNGEGIIITNHNKLDHYLRLLVAQVPIESQFISKLVDNLNAEIVLGTVTNMRDAVQWLSYTYLYIRMLKNPMAYGITYNQKSIDPNFENERKGLIHKAAQRLDQCKMIRYDEENGNFYSTDLGRIASHFYIVHETIELFNEFFIPKVKISEKYNEIEKVISMSHKHIYEEVEEYDLPREKHVTDSDIMYLLSQSVEFKNIILRDDEVEELKQLEDNCPLEVKGGFSTQYGKVNILIQSYISRIKLESFSLTSDMAYISQNASRIARSIFEMAMRKNWPRTAHQMLRFCKMIDHRIWITSHPLAQFKSLNPTIISKLESKRLTVDRLRDMSSDEIGALLNANNIIGKNVLNAANFFPSLEIEATVQPLTRTILKVHLKITPDFDWNDKIHGIVEPWWILVEDTASTYIYHSEYFLLYKKQRFDVQYLSFVIPIDDPPPAQYQIYCISDRWIGAETTETISFSNLILPHEHPPHTELLGLLPLSVKCLENEKFEELYPFQFFNPIQTQTFHTMYHTDTNVLVGAPTGSGKTIVAEFAMLKLFRDNPELKVIYIAPLKALVRERIKDWKRRFQDKLGKRLVELTGDFTPDILSLLNADIITTTPEKWDGISRNWKHRDYVKKVGLMIIDEIHLLGEERGPILEVIVSRMRFISETIKIPVRIVGLSTALANAINLADWLGIDPLRGLFNFRPSVRPIPLEVHISGFRGKQYCPRMATMNKPSYSAIKTYSPNAPVLIFVSSRRQTRLTALDLINLCGSDLNPRRFLHMSEEELNSILPIIKDTNLAHSLSFGIGLHHGGLNEEDKEIVEDLFRDGKIQILISTATLAWGVNLPAHLVIIKGTEFYDPKTKRYQDYAITDVLQMMGRAGRPQFDSDGYAYACIFVEESKKNFYQKFLYDPFPVESSLPGFLHDHINAEIASETIKSKQDAVDYLTWTYFFRRLLKNPSYYNLDDTSTESLNKYLSDMIDRVLKDLEEANCISVDDDTKSVETLFMGKIASFYYIHYLTMKHLSKSIIRSSTINDLLHTLCFTQEYRELPVRHNEDLLNAELAKKLPLPIDPSTVDSPHTKAFLLLQAHFERIEFPIVDYVTDTKSVLDQSIRILQAMIDVSAEYGFLETTLNAIHLQQMCIQGEWYEKGMRLPYLSPKVWETLKSNNIHTISQIVKTDISLLRTYLEKELSKSRLEKLLNAVVLLPNFSVDYNLKLKETSEDYNTYKIDVNINRIGYLSEGGIFAPRFPKHKDEGWFVVIGNKEEGDLLALKKMTTPIKREENKLRISLKLEFEISSESINDIYLYVMPDCYIGLDQEVKIKFETTH